MGDTNPEDTKSILIKVLTYLVAPKKDVFNADETEKKLVQWVEDMQMNFVEGVNPFLRTGYVSPVNKLLVSLRECLLTQRWHQALELMTAISKNHRDTGHLIFKVGLEICHQLDPSKGRSLEQILGQLRHITGPNHHDLALEYIFYLLSQPETADSKLIEECLHFMSMFKKPYHKSSLNGTIDKEAEMENIYKAYKGLLLYNQWLLSKQSYDDVASKVDFEEDIIETFELGGDKRLLDIMASRAIDSLQGVQSISGVWDIFVPKLVKLLEFTGDEEAAENVLKENCSVHSDNPNAHRYLLNFYKQHNNEEEVHKVTKTLAEMLPTDVVALDYYKILKLKAPNHVQCAPILFNLLDYPCWRNNAEVWQLLFQEMIDILNGEADEAIGEMLQEAWFKRSSWWPAYHFVYPEKTVLTDDHLNIFVLKASIAILFSTGGVFVDAVKASVTDHPRYVQLLQTSEAASENLQLATE